MSLNNRITFRDAYCTAGSGFVDLRAVPFPINGDSSEATIEAIIIEPEKSQKDLMDQSPAEVDECESHDCHVMVPIFSRLAIRSRGCRHRLTPTLTNSVMLIYCLRMERCLETTSIYLFISYDLHAVHRVHMGHLPEGRVRGSADTTRLFDTGKSQVGGPENAVIRIIQISYFHLFSTSFFFRD